jgi:hypothetical protein
MTDWLFLLSPWLALVCLIIRDARLSQSSGSSVQIQSEANRSPLGSGGQFDVSPDFAALMDTIRQEGRAYRKEEQREDRGKRFREWITIVPIALTFIAVCYQVREMIKVYDPIRDQAIAANESASATNKSATASAKVAEDSEKSLVAGSRAWVGPTDAKITSGAPAEGQPVKVVISVRNSGREPARDVRWIPTKIVDANEGTLNQKMDTNLRFCLGTPSQKFGQVIYPTGGFGEGFEYTVQFDGSEIDQEVIDGNRVFVVQGCLTYESFGATRHSAFCFLFKNKTTALEHLNICSTGSSAD